MSFNDGKIWKVLQLLNVRCECLRVLNLASLWTVDDLIDPLVILTSSYFQIIQNQKMDDGADEVNE